LKTPDYDLHQGAPPLDFATVAWLNKLYPPTLPSLEMSEREIWLKVGQRQVVEHLQTILNKQSQQEAWSVENTTVTPIKGGMPNVYV